MERALGLANFAGVSQEPDLAQRLFFGGLVEVEGGGPQEPHGLHWEAALSSCVRRVLLAPHPGLLPREHRYPPTAARMSAICVRQVFGFDVVVIL